MLEVPRDAVEELGLKERRGALVAQVPKDGPAAKAGIQPGDVIIEVNGKPIADREELTRIVTGTKPGTTIPVTLVRDRKQMTLNVTIEKLDLEAESGGSARGGTEEDTTAGFGLSLGNITPSMARSLRLPEGMRGAVIMDIEQGSAADGSGLAQGDVILKVNNQEVSSAATPAASCRRSRRAAGRCCSCGRAARARSCS